MDRTLIFLDTETTGIWEWHKVIQLAYLYWGKFVNVFLNPERNIDEWATRVHGITNEMVKDCDTFKKSIEVARLKTLIDKWAVVIAHNADFDIWMLKQEWLECPLYIDTLRLAMTLWEKGVEHYAEHNLQYLKDYYHIEVGDDVKAHDAYWDVVVLKEVYDMLQANFEWVDEMIEISKNPVKMSRFKYWKYKWEKIEDVMKKDMEYLVWMKGHILEKPEKDWSVFDKSMFYSISFYL